MNRIASPAGIFRLRTLFADRRFATGTRAFLLDALSTLAWAATAIFLGCVVGFAAVILPPTGVFGIVAVAGLALLWAMPDLRLLPQRTLSTAFLVVLFCMLCIPNYYALDVLGLPWISIRRVALLALILPVAVATGGSAAFRGEISKKLACEKALSICIIGFLIWSALSILATENVPQTVTAVVDDALTFYVPFFACLYLLKSAEDVERLMVKICWFSFVPAALGIIEFFMQRRFYFDLLPEWYLNALKAANPAVAVMVVSSPFRNGFYRASSIFDIVLSFGEFEMMVAPIGWSFLLDGDNTKKRLLGLAVTAASAVALFAAGSRGAYVGTLAALAAFASLWILRHARQHRESLVSVFATVLSVALAVAIGTLIAFTGRLHALIFGSSSIDQASTQARWNQWNNLEPKLWASPILGHGRAMSGVVIDYYYPGSLIPTVDSYLLALLADVGFPGATFFFGAIVLGIWTAARQYIVDASKGGALAGGLSCSLIGFGVYRLMLAAAENHFLFFLILAMIITISATRSATTPTRSKEPMNTKLSRTRALGWNR